MGGRLVYSTDPRRQPCARCGAWPCECPREVEALPAAQQRLRVHVDRKARRGKAVMRIEGFVGPREAREEIARRLKAACGAGGSVKEEAIEIQGENLDAVARLLEGMGFHVDRR